MIMHASTYCMCNMESILTKCGDSWYGKNNARVGATLNSLILMDVVSRLFV